MTSIRRFVREHPRSVGVALVGVSLAGILLAVAVVGNWLGREPLAQATSTATPNGEASHPQGPVASAPSATPGASAGPTRSGTAYALTDVSTPIFRSVWARVAVDELNVRREPGTGGEIVGTLERGDLIVVTDDPRYVDERSWAPIVANGISGWAAERDDEDVYLQPVATPWRFGSRRDFNGVVSNGNTFLAYGTASDLAVLPYEGSGVSALAYVSTDGMTWERLDALHGNLSAADGSADWGFVVVAQPTYIEPTFIWLSDDGIHWAEPIPVDIDTPTAAVGPGGAIVAGTRYGTEGVVVIRAADADENPLRIPAEELAMPQLEGSRAGYVMFDRYGSVSLLVSRDGATWNEASVPGLAVGQHVIRDVELIGNRVLIVAARIDTGAAVIRQGALSADGAVSWDAWTNHLGLGEATVDSVSASPEGSLLALGWERDDLVPLVWRSADGWGWENVGVAANAFGGAIGPEPAFARGVWAAVTDGIYTSTDGVTWTQRVGPAPQPDGPGCPAVDDVTALDVLFLGGAAADCYGDTSLTFVAWAPLVDGLGGCCYPESSPEWLNAAIPYPWLAPAPSTSGGFGDAEFGVALSPSMSGRMPTEAWVEVTGHFHDPASADCRAIPLTSFPHRLVSAEDTRDGCERRFVVDRVVTVDGPQG